jgi:serine/threonine-protein kinase HipA
MTSVAIERKQTKLAMARVGAKNHYRIDGIQARHFFETGRAAGLSKATVQALIDEIRAMAGDVMGHLADELPPRFPKSIQCPSARP